MAKPGQRIIRTSVDWSNTGMVLVQFLAGRFTYRTIDEWTDRIKSGEITLNGKSVQPEYILQMHDCIEYHPQDIPEPPAPISVDKALEYMRDALELGDFGSLFECMVDDCRYISVHGGAHFDSKSIRKHLRRVAKLQLEQGIFLDCALATITESKEGNSFPVGTRCLVLFENGKCEDIAFLTLENGRITEIIITNEYYRFKCDVV